MAASLQELFSKGLYQEILRITVDAPSWKKTATNVLPVIGALCFTGRMDEAEILAASLLKTPSQAIIARFYLGLGFTRRSEYARALALFTENLKETRQRKNHSATDLFFIHQGASFYRFYSGKFQSAKRSSDIAFKSAFAADDLYGKVLSTDIRGHILVQLGEASAGFELLTRAEKLARSIGNGSLPIAIQISKMIYRARLGFDPKSSLRELEAGITTLSPDDNYSRANFLLELARQWALRGRSGQALSILDKASEHVYANQNRRQETTLNLRYAYLHYCSGDFSRGLSMTRSAKRTLHPSVDRVLEQETLDLELKLLEALGMDSHAHAVKAQIRKSTTPLRAGENPLAELLEVVKKNPADAVDDIIENDYLHLLYDVLKIQRQQSCLYLDLQPGLVLVFDRGNVSASKGLTPLLRKILRALEKGFCSKENLITQVWGYEYDPLRHDTVIYAAMNSLRRLLGERAAWLETVENGYRWNPAYEICTHRTAAPMDVPRAKETPVPDGIPLNYRQIQILRYLAKEEFVEVQKYKKLFKVSDITASRDLSDLTNQGLLERIGRGRAIRYKLMVAAQTARN